MPLCRRRLCRGGPALPSALAGIAKSEFNWDRFRFMTRATPYSFRQSPVRPVTPLKVIFLADTRPGHYHLAEGVIAAVKRLRPVEVTRIPVERRWIVPTRWLRRRINAKSFFPPRMLRMAYRIDAEALPKRGPRGLRRRRDPDAEYLRDAVSRCAQHFLRLAAARAWDLQNFSLVISSYDRDAGSARHMVVLKPSAIDPDTLGRPASVPRYGPGEPSAPCRTAHRRQCRALPLPARRMGAAAWFCASPVQGLGHALACLNLAADA